jgi:hypothetical protein
MKYYGILDKGPHYLEIINIVPEWTSEDEGRLFYYNGQLYYGTDSGWIVQRGESGYSGYDGIDGNMAVSGTSGYSGYNGISGYSGYSGEGISHVLGDNESTRTAYYVLNNGIIINYGWFYKPDITKGTYTVNYEKTFNTKCYYSNAYLILTDVNISSANIQYMIHVNPETYTSLTSAKYLLKSNLSRNDFVSKSLGFYWISIGY